MRCIKPNDGQRPSDFDAPLTLHQLRCCGVLEVTRIARAGYPTRYLHRQFAERYHALLHGNQSGALEAAHVPSAQCAGMNDGHRARISVADSLMIVSRWGTGC